VNFFLQDKSASISNKVSNRFLPVAQGGLRISLILFLFSLPLNYITAVREIILGLAAFFWIILMVLNREVLVERTPIDWQLLAWVGVASLSLVWAVNPGYTFNEIKGEIIKGLVVYYLVYFSLKQEDHFKQLYMALIFGDLLMVSFNLPDFYTQGGDLFNFSSKFSFRARSMHSGYGSFGTYLITVFPFLLIGGFSPLLKKFRWALWGLILLNLFCIYTTFGRAMWLAAGVEVAALGFFFKRKLVVLILALGVLAFFFVIPKTVWFHGEKLSSVEEMTSKSMGGTAGDLVEIWKFSFAFFQERPLQGVGFGRQSFSQAFTDFRAKHQPLLWHAHNTFLDIFFQTGVQGLAIFLWLVISILYYLFRRSKEGLSSWPGMISISALIMVIGFFTRNLFDDFYIDDNALLFWLLVGASLSGSFRKKAGVSR
jgi:O-antigen ligase